MKRNSYVGQVREMIIKAFEAHRAASGKPEEYRIEETVKKDQWIGVEHETMVLTLATDVVTIEVHVDKGQKKPAAKDARWSTSGTGHTTFQTSKGKLTFDRLGVEDSFYVNGNETVESLTAKIAEQFTRAAASIERIAKCVTLPLGINRTPEEIEKMRETLLSGNSVTIHPSGFGTGYILSTRPPAARRRFASYGPKANPELAKALRLDAVYVDKYDAD